MSSVIENREKKENVHSSREILFLFDARDCNPNGERDEGLAGPRIDPYTNKAMVTDVCLKRTIREYWNKKFNSNTDNVLIRNSGEYTLSEQLTMKKVFLRDLHLDIDDSIEIYSKDWIKECESKISDLEKEDLYKLIKSRFIDHRLFGSIIKIKGEFFNSMGPVQFENSLSLNIPTVHQVPITSTIASESGKGAGAMGRYYFLDYAIFFVHGIFKKSLADITGTTEKDLLKLYDGLWNGIKSNITRTKLNQYPRLLLSIKMKDFRTQIPSISKSIELRNKDARNYIECELNVERLVELLKDFGKEIDSIEYKQDLQSNFYYQGENFKDVRKMNDFIDYDLNFKEINFKF